MIQLAEKTQYPHFIGFLNMHEQAVLSTVLVGKRKLNYRFFGGYEQSERSILAVADNSDTIEDYYFPIAGITFRYKSEFSLTHRDFLGAVMALGIKRETIGDILVADGFAVMFVKEEIRDYLITQIRQIGKVGIISGIWNGNPNDLPVKKDFEPLHCTVSSARLDSIVSAIVPLSREKSAAIIRQGAVFLNSMQINDVSRSVKSGDIISIRGKGKFRIEEFSGITKKGRLKAVVKKYR